MHYSRNLTARHFQKLNLLRSLFIFRETNKPVAPTGRIVLGLPDYLSSGGLAGERRLVRELQTYGVRARAARSGRSIQAVS